VISVVTRGRRRGLACTDSSLVASSDIPSAEHASATVVEHVFTVLLAMIFFVNFLLSTAIAIFDNVDAV